MRGVDSAELLEDELADLLARNLSQLKREAAELSIVAECLEQAVDSVTDRNPDNELMALTKALEAGVAHATLLMAALQVRVFSVQGIGIAFETIGKSKATAVAGTRRST